MTEQSSPHLPTTPEADPTGVVVAFLESLRDRDMATATALVDDALLYQNVGLSTVRGGPRTVALLTRLLRVGRFDVVVHRSGGDGSTVLNERTDAIIVGPLRLQFWVCGVFELHDGRITLWRDYVDTVDFLRAVVRGVAGAVVPALRPQFADPAVPAPQRRRRSAGSR